MTTLTLLETQLKNKFNVDYASIQKGDYFTKDQIEEITGLKQGTTRYQSGILQLKAEMEKNLKFHNVDCVIKQEDYGLLVCSDTRASDYVWDRFNSHLKGTVNYTNKMRHNVDTTNLSNKDKDSYYKRLQIATEVTEVALKTKKKIIGLQNNRERAVVAISNSTAKQLNEIA